MQTTNCVFLVKLWNQARKEKRIVDFSYQTCLAGLRLNLCIFFMREWMFFLLLLTVFMREILPHCVYLLMDYWLMRCGGGVVWRAIARLRKAIEFVRLRTLSCTDSDCISRKSPARWNRRLSSSPHYYRTCPADRVNDSSNVLCVMKCWSVAEG